MTQKSKHMLCVITKECIDLGKYELLAQTKCKLTDICSHIYTLQTTYTSWKNLAFIQKVVELFFVGSLQTFEQTPLSFTSKTYSVEITHTQKETITSDVKKRIYAKIYKSQKTPVISLDNPTEVFEVFITPDNIYVGKRIYLQTKEFLLRKTQLLPFKNPVASSPKISKAMCNLTGLVTGSIYDPFCGQGGILVEALHNGFTVFGSDIDPDAIQKAKHIIEKQNINSQFQKQLNKHSLYVHSALTTTQKADAIVSDLPYGKGTKNISSTLYTDFLTHCLREKLAPIAILCFPHYAKVQQILESLQIPIIFETYIPIHKNLQRHIIVCSLT